MPRYNYRKKHPKASSDQIQNMINRRPALNDILSRPKLRRVAKPRVRKPAGAGVVYDYPGAGRAIGSSIGSVFGPIGSMAGGFLGNAAHSIIKHVTGFGGYKIQANSLIPEAGAPPKVRNTGNEFVVSHREYLTDIFSASGAANSISPFALQNYFINPGLASTLPWVSRIAAQFEQYRIQGMLFEFKSMFSDAVVTSNGALGNIILATEYNAAQPNFQSKVQMENMEFAQSCKPSTSVIHPIECKRSQNVLNELYVRTGNVLAGEDVKMYDFGNFQIATQGIPLGGAGAAVNLGELWVSYEIAFLKPKIQTVGAVYLDSGFGHVGGIFSTSTNGPYPAFSTVPSIPPVFGTNNLGISLVSNTTLAIPLLPYPMNYEVVFNWFDTSLANSAGWGAPQPSTLTNCTLTGPLVGTLSGNYFQTPGRGATATTCGANLTFTISCPGSQPGITQATILMGNVSLPLSGTLRWDCSVNAIPQNIV